MLIVNNGNVIGNAGVDSIDKIADHQNVMNNDRDIFDCFHDDFQLFHLDFAWSSVTIRD